MNNDQMEIVSLEQLVSRAALLKLKARVLPDK